jgi:integrase
MTKRFKDRDGIYQRPDRQGFWGSWSDTSGKRRRRMFKAQTLTQARALLAAEKARVEKALTLTPPGAESFSEFTEVFLDYQRRRITSTPVKGKISLKEFTRQKGILALHLIPFFDEMKLARIRRKDVNDYIDARVGKVSDGTIIKEVNTLKRLFSVAVSKEKIPTNPAHGADIPEAPKGRVRYLEARELEKLMRACQPWLRPIVGLALSLGTRRGELMKVGWGDIDLAANRILLNHTKNGRPRYVYLNSMSRQVIDYLSEGSPAKLGALFPDVSPEKVSVAFIRVCSLIGIEDFSLHDLRHSFAALARMNGVDLHTLQNCSDTAILG